MKTHTWNAKLVKLFWPLGGARNRVPAFSEEYWEAPENSSDSNDWNAKNRIDVSEVLTTRLITKALNLPSQVRLNDAK
jgi:hypothetical protein